jgi:hypothetical protein
LSPETFETVVLSDPCVPKPFDIIFQLISDIATSDLKTMELLMVCGNIIDDNLFSMQEFFLLRFHEKEIRKKLTIDYVFDVGPSSYWSENAVREKVEDFNSKRGEILERAQNIQRKLSYDLKNDYTEVIKGIDADALLRDGEVKNVMLVQKGNATVEVRVVCKALTDVVYNLWNPKYGNIKFFDDFHW